MFLPSLSGGPNQVREYLTQVLITKHDAPSTLAANIASKWQLGRPINVREATLEHFKSIFGSEDGGFLFQSVQVDLANEFYASPAGVFNYWATALSVFLGAFFLVRAFYSSSDDRSTACFRACFVLGPPMIFLAFQGSYGSENFMRIVVGCLASIVGIMGLLLNGMLRNADREIEDAKARRRRMRKDEENEEDKEG